MQLQYLNSDEKVIIKNTIHNGTVQPIQYTSKNFSYSQTHHSNLFINRYTTFGFTWFYTNHAARAISTIWRRLWFCFVYANSGSTNTIGHKHRSQNREKMYKRQLAFGNAISALLQCMEKLNADAVRLKMREIQNHYFNQLQTIIFKLNKYNFK